MEGNVALSDSLEMAMLPLAYATFAPSAAAVPFTSFPEPPEYDNVIFTPSPLPANVYPP